VDHRTDVYSLGATLHHLLAGSPPFSGASVGEILVKVLRGAVPALRAVRPDVPARLEAVCRRAMAGHPGDRFASASDFAAALAEAGEAV
jgi:serine/threonine-protein kinase